MRIGINARLLAEPEIRGWTRYTLNLVRELTALGVELYLYSDRRIHDGHRVWISGGKVHLREAPPLRYTWWEQVWLPWQAGEDRIDLLHSPFNFGLPWFSRCRRVLTLHDAIDQVYYGRRRSLRSRMRPGHLRGQVTHWGARKRAHHVITVSRHSRKDLVEHLGLPEEKVSVVYEAADDRFHRVIPPEARAAVRREHRLTRPYFFYVGGLERRKNIPFLIRSFGQASLPDVDLVLAGGNSQDHAELAPLLQELGLEQRVRFLGAVADESLPTLYAEAIAFVYPSEYEGFGLQLCEAMAVGCPVLAADATSLPEVLGDGGLTFGLERPAQLAEPLRRLARDPAFVADLSARARHGGLRFSWRKTALDTLSVYERVLSGRGAPIAERQPAQPGAPA